MSATENIVRDIFGDSDESEDEFEGFEGENNAQEGEKSSWGQKSDDDDEDEEVPQEKQEDDGEDYDSRNKDGDEEDGSRKEVIPEISDNDDDDDDDDDDSGFNKEEKPDIRYDFDIMLQRRKEMNSRRRRRKNVDIINDSDEIIAEMIQEMKQAAEEDFELNRNQMTATRKLKLLPEVEPQLKKIDLRDALLDSGILGTITDWLTRLPDGSLPHLQIREKLLKILVEFNIDDVDRIKASGIGKAVMYLFKHPKETKENKKIASQLIASWARPIFNLDTNFHSISRDQREQRDLENMSRFKRSHSDSGEGPSGSKQAKNDQRVIRPGDKGWVPRARVPMPSMKDYVVRPKSQVEVDMTRISSKKPVTRLDKHMRNFREMKKINKMNRAIPISIEGRKMAL